MVIGNGLIAKRFSVYNSINDVVIFASGVSNSKNTENKDYQREANLLLDTIKKNPTAVIVYFSTCSIYDSGEANSPYVIHKINMETLLQKEHPNYYIFRVSNLAGVTDNPNTILNFFVKHIREGKHFNLWINAERNLIDIDDLFTIVNGILQTGSFQNQVINIANTHNYKVTDIISAVEVFTGNKANCTSLQKGHSLRIDLAPIKTLLEELQINFDKDYLFNLLKKYYS